jgi:hypothetical protein
MDFESLSLPGAPSMVTPPPGPASRAQAGKGAEIFAEAVKEVEDER